MLGYHVRQFIVLFPDRPVIPHVEWLGSQGGARNIILDKGTFDSLILNEPFSRMFLLRNPDDQSRHMSASTSSRTTKPSSSQGISTIATEAFCLWHAFELLKLVNKAGAPFTCKKGCTADRHRAINTVRLSEMLAAINSCRFWSKEFKDYLSKSTKSMQSKFRRE